MSETLVEIPVSDIKDAGRYVFTFVPGILWALTPSHVDVPKTTTIPFYTLTLESYFADETTKLLKLTVRLEKTSNVQTSGGLAVTPTETAVDPKIIIGSLVGIIGLTVAYLSLQKVEKIVTAPGVSTAISGIGLLIAAGAVIWLLREWRKR